MPTAFRTLLRLCALTASLAVCAACASSGGAAELGSALPSRLPQSSGAGGTWWVDAQSGSDSAAGTRQQPWRTINKALATVPLEGSIIMVRAGVYESRSTQYALLFNRKASADDPVTLRAETPGTVRIRNADLTRSTLGAWIVKARGLRVEGLSFEVTAQPGSNVSANHVLVENSDRIEFTRCRFVESGTFQVRGGSVDGDTADDVWLLGNTFRPSGNDVFAHVAGVQHDPSTYAGSKGSHYVYAGQVGDVSKGFEYMSGSQRFVAANNLFVGTAAGRHVELGPQARGSFVVNNTFYGNHAGSVIGWDTGARFAGEGVVLFANTESSVPAATRDNVVANNLFAELDGHAVYGSGPSQHGNVVERNLSWKVRNGMGHNGDPDDDYDETYGTSVLFGEGRGNFASADPRFAAAASFDFRLRSGSPAIGRADPAYSPPTDHNGGARDSEPDLGALEQGAAGSSDGSGETPTAGGDAERELASSPAARRPVNRVRPSVAQRARRGLMVCRAGRWAGGGSMRFSYRWKVRHGKRLRTVRAATRRTYRVRRGDAGRRLVCVVTARNEAGARRARSKASSRVSKRAVRSANAVRRAKATRRIRR